MKKISVWYFYFVLILFFSCEEEQTPIRTTGPHVLVDLQDDPYCQLESYAYTASSEIMKSIINEEGLEYLLPFVNYDVSVHHITYMTNYKDSTLLASGAICIPINDEKKQLLSFQHGTIINDNITPSEFTTISSWGMELTASNGYITFIPDYIGYGTTKDILHPYHLYTPLVDAAIDMIVEGKFFLRTNQIDYDTTGIFLAGFSEGGYATFAVQKEIQLHPEYDLIIKASAPGAGAYELEYMFEVTTQNDYYPGPGYMALALWAYNEYYWNYPLENLFNPDYIPLIISLLDGTHDDTEVQNRLPKNLSTLLNNEFLEDFRNNPDNVFREKLQENSLNNWLIKCPTRFIHGINDQTVPFEVAQKTYNDLIALGVDPDDLTLEAFNAGHNDLIYMSLMLKWFETFDK